MGSGGDKKEKKEKKKEKEKESKEAKETRKQARKEEGVKKEEQDEKDQDFLDALFGDDGEEPSAAVGSNEPQAAPEVKQDEEVKKEPEEVKKEEEDSDDEWGSWGTEASPAARASSSTAPAPGDNKLQLHVGDEVQADFEGRGYYLATVVRVGAHVVKVRWSWDNTEADVARKNIRAKDATDATEGGAAAAAEARPIFKDGQLVDASFQDRGWYSAKITQVFNGSLRVKWDYDGSESDLLFSEVKLKEGQEIKRWSDEPDDGRGGSKGKEKGSWGSQPYGQKGCGKGGGEQQWNQQQKGASGPPPAPQQQPFHGGPSKGGAPGKGGQGPTFPPPMRAPVLKGGFVQKGGGGPPLAPPPTQPCKGCGPPAGPFAPRPPPQGKGMPYFPPNHHGSHPGGHQMMGRHPTPPAHPPNASLMADAGAVQRYVGVISFKSPTGFGQIRSGDFNQPVIVQGADLGQLPLGTEVSFRLTQGKGDRLEGFDLQPLDVEPGEDPFADPFAAAGDDPLHQPQQPPPAMRRPVDPASCDGSPPKRPRLFGADAGQPPPGFGQHGPQPPRHPPPAAVMPGPGHPAEYTYGPGAGAHPSSGSSMRPPQPPAQHAAQAMEQDYGHSACAHPSSGSSMRIPREPLPMQPQQPSAQYGRGSPANAGHQPQAPPAPAVKRSDPEQVLRSMPKPPHTIQQWADAQDEVFAGHPDLYVPTAWIRVWSRNKRREYYVNVYTLTATFDINDTKRDT